MAQRDADGEVLTAKDANHAKGEIVFIGFAWFAVQNTGGMDWEVPCRRRRRSDVYEFNHVSLLRSELKPLSNPPFVRR